MAVENGLVITITGDTSDLENSLKVVSKKITETGHYIGNQGAIGGKAFNQKMLAEFDQIQNLATGSFTGLARSFITLAANPITLALAGIGATLYGAFSLSRFDEENKKIARNFEIIAQNAGQNADTLKKQIEGIADGYIGMSEILPVASAAIIKLGTNAEQTGKLFELSRNIAVSTGKSIERVFEDLTNGVVRQNQKLLQNNLIKIDAQKAILDFANTNNIAVKSLSDEAKQQAILNAVLKEGKKNFKDTGGEIAPLEGGIRKLKIAAGDLKDAFAAIVNSRVGIFFANLATGAANALKTIAISVDQFSDKPKTLEQDFKRVEAQIARLNQMKISNPNDPTYAKQIEELTTKLNNLKVAREAVSKAQTTDKTEKDKSAYIDQEAEKARLAQIQSIRDEQRKIELDAEREQNLALLELDPDASFEEKEAAKLQIKKDYAEAEYQLQLQKNQNIKDTSERTAANELALAKKSVADQKAESDKKITFTKSEADAKRQIEANFWEASLNFAQGNAEATKAIQIAQAIRNTYQGASLALANYPPPINAILAASTIALGLSHVAKITAANRGALVTGGEVGKDTNPFLLSKGEIVAPAKSYDNVVEGEIRARGYVKGDENQMTNSLLEKILEKLETPSIVVNSDFLTDENSINKLAEKLREAVQFRGAALS